MTGLVGGDPMALAAAAVGLAGAARLLRERAGRLDSAMAAAAPALAAATALAPDQAGRAARVLAHGADGSAVRAVARVCDAAAGAARRGATALLAAGAAGGLAAGARRALSGAPVTAVEAPEGGVEVERLTVTVGVGASASGAGAREGRRVEIVRLRSADGRTAYLVEVDRSMAAGAAAAPAGLGVDGADAGAEAMAGGRVADAWVVATRDEAFQVAAAAGLAAGAGLAGRPVAASGGLPPPGRRAVGVTRSVSAQAGPGAAAQVETTWARHASGTTRSVRVSGSFNRPGGGGAGGSACLAVDLDADGRPTRLRLEQVTERSVAAGTERVVRTHTLELRAPEQREAGRRASAAIARSAASPAALAELADVAGGLLVVPATEQVVDVLEAGGAARADGRVAGGSAEVGVALARPRPAAGQR